MIIFMGSGLWTMLLILVVGFFVMILAPWLIVPFIIIAVWIFVSTLSGGKK